MVSLLKAFTMESRFKRVLENSKLGKATWMFDVVLPTRGGKLVNIPALVLIRGKVYVFELFKGSGILLTSDKEKWVKKGVFKTEFIDNPCQRTNYAVGLVSSILQGFKVVPVTVVVGDVRLKGFGNKGVILTLDEVAPFINGLSLSEADTVDSDVLSILESTRVRSVS